MKLLEDYEYTTLLNAYKNFLTQGLTSNRIQTICSVLGVQIHRVPTNKIDFSWDDNKETEIAFYNPQGIEIGRTTDTGINLFVEKYIIPKVIDSLNSTTKYMRETIYQIDDKELNNLCSKLRIPAVYFSGFKSHFQNRKHLKELFGVENTYNYSQAVEDLIRLMGDENVHQIEVSKCGSSVQVSPIYNDKRPLRERHISYLVSRYYDLQEQGF